MLVTVPPHAPCNVCDGTPYVPCNVFDGTPYVPCNVCDSTSKSLVMFVTVPPSPL